MKRPMMLSVIAEAVRLARDPMVTVGLVRGGSRLRRPALVRDRAIDAIHAMRPDLKLKEIGGAFGLDHSTVSVAISRHTRRRAESVEAAAAYETLLAAFAPGARPADDLSAAMDRAEAALLAATAAVAAARELADLARVNGHG